MKLCEIKKAIIKEERIKREEIRTKKKENKRKGREGNTFEKAGKVKFLLMARKLIPDVAVPFIVSQKNEAFSALNLCIKLGTIKRK